MVLDLSNVSSYMDQMNFNSSQNLTTNSTMKFSGHRPPKVDVVKLVVLAIIIFFTVVGNFGVILSILARRSVC